jgi:2-polyprenyl-6-methoxyphenol hydroxylase-like FAD-dependent oxidoreductase
MNKGLTTTS